MNDQRVMAFDASLRELEDATTDRLRRAAMAVAFLIGEHVVIGGPFGNATGTPVDTGFARAQWTPSLHDPMYTPEEADPSWVKGQASLAATTEAYALGDAVWFTNGASYIRPLEGGHSRQAPLGMIAPLLANAQPLVTHVVEQLRKNPTP